MLLKSSTSLVSEAFDETTIGISVVTLVELTHAIDRAKLEDQRKRRAEFLEDLVAGTRKAEPDAIGIDVSPRSAADIIWNLDEFPWPVQNDTFDRIHMAPSIEHVRDVKRTIAEIYRVGRDLTARSFQYFTGEDFAMFTGANVRFAIQKVELTFGKNCVLDGLGRWLAARNLDWYERHAA